MRLIVTAFVTLDGVIEAPGFDEHRDGKNAWALRIQNEDDEEYNTAQVFDADAFLLGRKTYQIWAAFWPLAEQADLTATGAEKLARPRQRDPEVRRLANVDQRRLEQHHPHRR